MTLSSITHFTRRTALAGAAMLAFAVSAATASTDALEKETNAMEKATFYVETTPLVGDVYTPDEVGKRPAVVIIGPMTFQKEQAPTEYAKRLADEGYVALAYDSRYRGESGGEPRAWENPFHKVEDLKAAVEYIRSRPDVDPEQVSILAICQGSSIAFRAAAEIEGLHSFATIAGHYRDAEGDLEWLGAEGLAARKAQGEAAKAKFEATGEVDYVKAVEQTDMNVGMPGEFVWVWYQPWADRGIWENRYAVMSDADLLAYESISAAETLTTPWLMIHGDNIFLPSAARRHMAAVPVDTPTKTIWDDTPHLDYYDQPEAIDRAVDEITEWFETDH
ncbi:MAG: alpha/beta fold hydrolase [Pseudomonadota bacterium]